MLQGYRGKAPADLRQLEQIMVGFSNLIVDFPEMPGNGREPYRHTAMEKHARSMPG